jgi:hypothetical protein
MAFQELMLQGLLKTKFFPIPQNTIAIEIRTVFKVVINIFNYSFVCHAIFQKSLKIQIESQIIVDFKIFLVAPPLYNKCTPWPLLCL